MNEVIVIRMDSAPFVRRMAALIHELESLPPWMLTHDPVGFDSTIIERELRDETMAYNLLAVRPLPCTNL
jgi:hypothetical protein